MSAHDSPRLTRRDLAEAGLAGPTAPARIVHIGLGAFHRAHQAWYTARAADSADWGIVAFAGRSGAVPGLLAPQGGVFTLIERGRTGDRFEHVGSIVDVRPGDRVRELIARLASPQTAVVTLTVTEAGYRLATDGRLAASDPDVGADMRTIAQGMRTAEPLTVIGRLVGGLRERRSSGAGPIAIVPCDNFPDNGDALRTAVLQMAAEASPGLVRWIEESVSFVSTSVDRITPRVEEALIDAVAQETGWYDAAPVAAEPFSDWTLSGEFPAGRPSWETSGAAFVDDVKPYESRKLWLLNGAHTLLAWSGRARGHRTVAEAIADPVCAAEVEAWWNEAERHLPDGLAVDQYRRALIERFQNGRIEHSLEQIAADSLTKLALRVAPVARRERQAGRAASGSAGAIGSWISGVVGGLEIVDARKPEIERALGGGDAVEGLLHSVAPDLAADRDFLASVRERSRARVARPGIRATLGHPAHLTRNVIVH